MPFKTPLYENHIKQNAHMLEFAGYLMPLRFSSDIKEHLAVRNSAGLFDVSHMGEIFIIGSNALDSCQKIFTANIANIADNQAIYSCMLNHHGGIIDDVIVYRFNQEKFLVCVNASNISKDFDWIKNYATAENVSNQFAQLALQGPHAKQIMKNIFGSVILDIKKFYFKQITNDIIIARTGYTGEDGFEIYLAPKIASEIWNQILVENSVIPCGLAARDTLRLEAGMRLYGNDITEEISPLEAKLNFCVDFEKHPHFIGYEALNKQKQNGLEKKFYGFEMHGNIIARKGYEIFDEQKNNIGFITSGTYSPTLQKPIALGYLKDKTDKYQQVYIKIRDKLQPAKVTKPIFYKAKQL